MFVPMPIASNGNKSRNIKCFVFGAVHCQDKCYHYTKRNLVRNMSNLVMQSLSMQATEFG